MPRPSRSDCVEHVSVAGTSPAACQGLLPPPLQSPYCRRRGPSEPHAARAGCHARWDVVLEPGQVSSGRLGGGASDSGGGARRRHQPTPGCRPTAMPLQHLHTGSQLEQQLDQWLQAAEAVPGQHARAIIAPHAGYRCAPRLQRTGAHARWQPDAAACHPPDLPCLTTVQVFGPRGGLRLQADRPHPSVS